MPAIALPAKPAMPAKETSQPMPTLTADVLKPFLPPSGGRKVYKLAVHRIWSGFLYRVRYKANLCQNL